MEAESSDRQDDLDSATRSATGLSAGPADAGVPGLTVLWHPDPHRIGELVALTGLVAGKSQRLSRREPLFAPPHGDGLPRELADLRLSRQPIRLSPRPGGGLLLDRSGTRTSVVAAGEPVAESRAFSPEELAEGVVLLLADRVALVLHRMEVLASQPPSFGLVGESAAIVRVRQKIERVADLPFTVLLRGESGTGKELVARGICQAGPRCHQPFVAVNMGAITPTLAAKELFGATRGAFTGADRDRSGYFQRADGGTLFLDEIGEMAPEVQVLLLRVLETHQVQPVGAQESRSVDVRVISATDADLEAAIAAGTFRSSVLHRLSGYEIELPPMRRRREDFGRLFLHFLRQEMETVGEEWRLRDPGAGRPWIGAELVSRLAAYGWPDGNVRHLRNVVRQLVVDNRGCEQVQAGSEIERLLARPTALPATETPQVSGQRSYRKPGSVRETELRDGLRSERWNMRRTAAQLDISRTTLYDLMKVFGIPTAVDLSREEIERCADRCRGDLEAMVDVLEVSRRGLLLRMRKLGRR